MGHVISFRVSLILMINSMRVWLEFSPYFSFSSDSDICSKVFIMPEALYRQNDIYLKQRVQFSSLSLFFLRLMLLIWDASALQIKFSFSFVFLKSYMKNHFPSLIPFWPVWLRSSVESIFFLSNWNIHVFCCFWKQKHLLMSTLTVLLNTRRQILLFTPLLHSLSFSRWCLEIGVMEFACCWEH